MKHSKWIVGLTVIGLLAGGIAIGLKLADHDGLKLADKDKTSEHKPKIEKIDGKLYVDGKPVEMVDGKLTVDGQSLSSALGSTTSIIRTDSEVAADRVNFPAPPKGVMRRVAHIPVEQIPHPLTLPRLFILDNQTGQSANLDALPAALADWLGQPQSAFSLQKEASLATALGAALDQQGKPITLSNKVRFSLVQWWAGWCHPCLDEAKQLGQLFAEHPMPEVEWITVEADPSREPDSAPSTPSKAAATP